VTRPLSVEAFGRALFTTGDLDPVYLMLEGAQLDRAALQRWCLAYWMFYHVGVASWLSERTGPEFWDAVEAGLAGEEQFPRGTERRHFRGNAARQAVSYLRRRWGTEPEGAAASLDARDNHSVGSVLQFADVARSVMEWTGFGPWIAFKVADMLDGVLGVPVDFSGAVPGGLFDDPVKGAVWAFYVEEAGEGFSEFDTWTGFDFGMIEHGYAPRLSERAEALRDFLTEHHDGMPRAQRLALTTRVVGGLLERFKHDTFMGHPIRIQEVETVLCKWKSHLNGHYPVGKDSQEIQHALPGWGDTAAKCREVLIEHQVSLY
jgi:hypothetical protein